MQEPDPQVVAAARAGDLDAFEQLVVAYQGDVWRLCFHLLRDRSLADDATQEALVRAYRFLPRYRGDSKLSTWLLSIARNCALDELRRAGRRRQLVKKLEGASESPGGHGGSAIEVREAVAALPLELKEPIVLIDMFGLSYREVSQMLRIPIGTVKSRVHRARIILAGVLGDEHRGRSREA